jgi:hypothetical protein
MVRVLLGKACYSARAGRATSGAASASRVRVLLFIDGLLR